MDQIEKYKYKYYKYLHKMLGGTEHSEIRDIVVKIPIFSTRSIQDIQDLRVQIDINTKVENLMTILSDKTQIPINEQKLLLDLKVLKKDEILKSCGVVANDTIIYLIRSVDKVQVDCSGGDSGGDIGRVHPCVVSTIDTPHEVIATLPSHDHYSRRNVHADDITRYVTATQIDPPSFLPNSIMSTKAAEILAGHVRRHMDDNIITPNEIYAAAERIGVKPGNPNMFYDRETAYTTTDYDRLFFALVNFRRKRRIKMKMKIPMMSSRLHRLARNREKQRLTDRLLDKKVPTNNTLLSTRNKIREFLGPYYVSGDDSSVPSPLETQRIRTLTNHEVNNTRLLLNPINIKIIFSKDRPGNYEEINVKVSPNILVEDIRNIIFDKTEGFSHKPIKQKIIFKGKQLEDYRSLAEYGIVDNSKLYVTRRMFHENY